MKEVLFINNLSTLNQCEFLAIKNNNNISTIIYDILLEYFVNKNSGKKIKKDSRSIYLMCSEGARESNVTVAQFIENIVKSSVEKNPLDINKKKSFLNLNS